MEKPKPVQCTKCESYRGLKVVSEPFCFLTRKKPLDKDYPNYYNDCNLFKEKK